MNHRYILLSVFLVFISFVSPGAMAGTQEARARYEWLNLIRREKFDEILPSAMRDNGVDMWIHVMRRGNPDPLAFDLGGTMGYFIFTDRGGDRIERAILGTDTELVENPSDYDIIRGIGSEAELSRFVAERDPKRIAVNMSSWLSVADGLSHTEYLKLVKRLGDKYAARLISSERLITDFQDRRVQSEIVAYAHACEIQRRIMEQGLATIQPNSTTREAFGWWANQQFLDQGLEPDTDRVGPAMPDVRYSGVLSPEETQKPEYAMRRGDFLSWDVGVRYLNFGTDFKRHAYLLKEGETSIPAGLQHAWDRGLEARAIIRRTFKAGHTAGETLKIVVEALDRAGFVYTPFTDTPKDEAIVASLGNSGKSGFSIDCHSVGNTGDSEVAVGPSMAPFRPDRASLFVRPNHLISFEFVVHTWVPEWNRRLAINFEDNAIVTERGVESLYPTDDQIIVVH